MDDCGICRIQRRMEAGDDPWAVARLRTGYVGLAPDQYYKGYTFFSARTCVVELYDLPHDERARFLHEMVEVAHAVQRAVHPVKMNYEALGNVERHLHWHLVPRHADDPRPFAPIWENLDYLRLVWTEHVTDDDALRDELRRALLMELRAADVEIERELL